MKKRLVQLLLLFSLFFNISHATIIAIEDDCHHESAHEYVMEQTEASECGDLCDLHHVFHFFAILDILNANFDTNRYNKKHTYTLSQYKSPLQEKSIKPPIA